MFHQKVMQISFCLAQLILAYGKQSWQDIDVRNFRGVRLSEEVCGT